MKKLDPEDVIQFIDGIVFVEQSLEQVRNYLHSMREHLILCSIVNQCEFNIGVLKKNNERF